MKLWKVIAALMLVIVPFTGVTAADAALNPNQCTYYKVNRQGLRGGDSACHEAATGALHQRVMIICQNEIRQTGWLYGPWIYVYVTSERLCPTTTDVVYYITMQVY